MGANVDRKGAMDIQGRKGIDVKHALGVETIDLTFTRTKPSAEPPTSCLRRDTLYRTHSSSAM